MEILAELRAKNPALRLYEVTDTAFAHYGRRMKEVDFTDMMEIAEQQSVPEEGNIYVASDEVLEQCPSALQVQKLVYGELAIQVGICHGNTHQLNALEFHQCSEVIVAITDFILLLGKPEDLMNKSYHSQQLEAFYVRAGEVLELFPRVLHFAPCSVSASGFKSIIILLAQTNNELEDQAGYLFKKNKWLVAHPESQKLIDLGAHVGIKGTNISINY